MKDTGLRIVAGRPSAATCRSIRHLLTRCGGPRQRRGLRAVRVARQRAHLPAVAEQVMGHGPAPQAGRVLKLVGAIALATEQELDGPAEADLLLSIAIDGVRAH
ncbi:hypothetical protein [Streptomyces sp. 2RAF24]|uniref:hypothetical protein n=1 Tax=Streptomyces sp. 2RAF24 TaxID=3232997 RepID=UPI003F974492